MPVSVNNPDMELEAYRIPALLASCAPLIEPFNPSNRHFTAKHFFQSLEEVANLAKWRDTDKLLIAKSKLRGEAADFLAQSPDLRVTSNYEQFKESVLERFETEEPLAVRLSALSNCYQRDGESVKEFATRLKAVAHNYLQERPDDPPRLSAMHDKTKLAQFVQGLKPHLKRVVLSADCSDFASCVRKATAEEMYAAMTALPIPVAAASAVPSGQNKYVDQYARHGDRQFHDEKIQQLWERSEDTASIIRTLADEMRGLKITMGELAQDRAPRVINQPENQQESAAAAVRALTEEVRTLTKHMGDRQGPRREKNPAPVVKNHQESDARTRCWTCESIYHLARNCPDGNGRNLAPRNNSGPKHKNWRTEPRGPAPGRNQNFAAGRMETGEQNSHPLN